MNTIEGVLQLRGDEKVAIISSRFNHIITDRLVEGARDCFLRHGGNEDLLDLVLVPGAYEIPFVLQKLLTQGDYDGICCLGAIIRGDTPHFDYVAAEATKGIANVTLKYGAAVTFGVLTTDSLDQAIQRAGSKAGNKGFESMSGLIELINLYQNLGV
ncbi:MULTISPECIES: 6,7-dimethyl-8-ribityllumazine synthase [Helicobacter]|uniref:6,7-dimethyl-8-ribityllumazine synthase n=1 Tax=Helicobacter equorum TaxID=361872 RepID=A0A3D8ISM0_9HELI|nr:MULTISPECIES: 6,7-dimethyl-8-ribityllumazine synthase [Helicobacter]MCI6313317.1 6,7-dimethyl-8-ribityllumazine synthase [Helicobacter sp.]MCI7711391.1 6,7-dimethyl-8-ribityllumazine synthase [Helicobacter sp.]MDD7345492.1 6,7-dimethyl-8-ribityllumazine synthase [Helicobacter sp.]MDY2824084.1 6,7-dimethyl-8-ribityllumazine synthase [Helicobacter sp.]PAV00826.1 6,7-dimethyl-8-ribityllumazine synthase [Helicobacter sp. TUL]